MIHDPPTSKSRATGGTTRRMAFDLFVSEKRLKGNLYKIPGCAACPANAINDRSAGTN
jgi:hypothetical protein